MTNKPAIRFITDNTAVGELFFLGGPFHVAGFVVAVVVDAVKCHARWPLANGGKDVAQEYGKTIPAFADFNAAAAVMFVVLVVGVVASIAHFLPRTIEIMLLSFGSGAAMNKTPIILLAATGFCVFSSKHFSWNNRQTSAITLALPQSAVLAVAADPSNRCQSAETCTRDINWIGHRTAPTVRVSSGGAGVLALASPRTIT